MNSENKREKEKTDWHFTIENLGPINHAKVHIKPLTVLIGPNSSGKSYFAVAIDSICNLTGAQRTTRRMQDNQDRKREKRKFLLGSTTEARKQLCEYACSSVSSIIKDVEQISQAEVNESLIGILKDITDSVEVSFSDTVENLITSSHDAIDIELCVKSIKTEIRIWPNKTKYIKIGVGTKPPPIVPEKPLEEISNLIRVLDDLGKFSDSPSEGTNLIRKIFVEAIIRGNRFPTYSATWFLPAARGSYLQTYHTVISSLFRSITPSLLGISTLQVPKYPSFAISLFENLRSLPRTIGPFADLADDLERYGLCGTVEVRHGSSLDIPEIIFVQEGLVIPWQRVSSGVSELAPLVLYVRHYIHSGNLLIFEEPEAHLHPRLVLEVVKLIVGLVNRDVNVIVTTHSQFFLSALNNHLRVSKLSKKQREGIKIDPLEPDKVSASLFRPCEESKYFCSEIIPITEDGIGEAEFVKIHKHLYEDSRMIDYRAS